MLLLRPYPVVAIGTMLTGVRFVLSLSILWSSLRSIDVRSSSRSLGNPTALGLLFVKRLSISASISLILLTCFSYL